MYLMTLMQGGNYISFLNHINLNCRKLSFSPMAQRPLVGQGPSLRMHHDHTQAHHTR
jgi:hypothetical protein